MTSENNKATDKSASEKNRRIIESLIFASSEPTTSKLISKTVGDIQSRQIESAVKELNEIYESANLSFRIRKIAEGYQFYLLPEISDFAARMFKKERKMRLSKAALETLAIVAYKQPVSKTQIEYIRGVASDGVLHNLLEKNLISISGRSDAAGRPLLYSATNEFLKFFGLESFKDLPKLTEIEELMREYQEAAMPIRSDSSVESDSEDDANGEDSSEEVSAEDDTITSTTDETASVETGNVEAIPTETAEKNGETVAQTETGDSEADEHSEPELAPATEQK